MQEWIEKAFRRGYSKQLADKIPKGMLGYYHTFSGGNMKEKRRELPTIDREAVAAQRDADQGWARGHLKSNWMDESFYRGLAADCGLRMAHWWKPSSDTRYIKRALKHVGKDSLWFKDTFGYSIKEYADYNPRTPAWVAQCMVLEVASYEDAKKDTVGDAIGGNA